MQNIKQTGVAKLTPLKRNLSLSTTLLSGKVFDENRSSKRSRGYSNLHIMKDELGSNLKFSLSSMSSGGSPKNHAKAQLQLTSKISMSKPVALISAGAVLEDYTKLDYKVPKTIVRFRIAHKKMVDKSKKESVFDEMARKNSTPSPNKYTNQVNWSKERKGSKFGKQKVDLLSEIIKKSKDTPGPLDYADKPRKTIKG